MKNVQQPIRLLKTSVGGIKWKIFLIGPGPGHDIPAWMQQYENMTS